MNNTEEKALNWLISQGYKANSIIYKKTPTFISTDKKFEVKRLYGNQIIFYNKQYQILKKLNNVLILVFRDNENEPFLKLKFEEIKDLKKQYKGVEINWVGIDEKVRALRLSEKTKERLKKFGKMGEDYDQLLNRLLDRIEKNEK